MVGTPPPPPPSPLKQWGAWKNAEGGTQKILVCKGEAEGSFHILLGDGGGGQVGVGIIFGGGYTPSACHVTLLILKVH